MKQDVKIYSTKLINKNMFQVSDKKKLRTWFKTRTKDFRKISDLVCLLLATCFYQFLH